MKHLKGQGSAIWEKFPNNTVIFFEWVPKMHFFHQSVSGWVVSTSGREIFFFRLKQHNCHQYILWQGQTCKSVAQKHENERKVDLEKAFLRVGCAAYVQCTQSKYCAAYVHIYVYTYVHNLNRIIGRHVCFTIHHYVYTLGFFIHLTLIQTWSIGITTQQKNVFSKMWKSWIQH